MLNKKYIISQFDELGSQKFKRKQRFLRKIEHRLYFSQLKNRKSLKKKMRLHFE